METYLFDCKEDLYGEECRVDFKKFLRPERKFPSLEALKSRLLAMQRMAGDFEKTEKWLSGKEKRKKQFTESGGYAILGKRALSKFSITVNEVNSNGLIPCVQHQTAYSGWTLRPSLNMRRLRSHRITCMGDH